LKECERLPWMIRRPPGQPSKQPWRAWWWVGAPRATVSTLTTSHIRRRLQSVSDALTREAMLFCDASGKEARHPLSKAPPESQHVAAPARHPVRNAIISLATAGSLAATVYAIPGLFPALHVSFSGTFLLSGLLVLYLAVLLFGFVPLLIWLRSIQCKRALFW